MQIRLAEFADLEAIMLVYSKAKQYMDRTGNPNQWKVGYPPVEMIRDDICKRQLYVVTEKNVVHASFFFVIGEDETYKKIYEGNWKSDTPYGVIHRVGSDGELRGVMRAIVDFCSQRINHLRIDTHEDNGTMQHVLEKLGFARCGIIYLPNGAPRIAYQIENQK